MDCTRMGRTQTSSSWDISVHSVEGDEVVVDVVLDEVRGAEGVGETWFDAIKQRADCFYQAGIHFLFRFNRRQLFHT